MGPTADATEGSNETNGAFSKYPTGGVLSTGVASTGPSAADEAMVRVAWFSTTPSLGRVSPPFDPKMSVVGVPAGIGASMVRVMDELA